MDNNLINLIKLNLIYKKKIIKYKYNKKNINIIKILIILNIIKYIKKTNKIIYIYINNLYKHNYINNIYKPSRSIFLKNSVIKKLTLKKKWIFLLSTNKGIMTNFEAVKKKTGGILILKINNG
jgi:ribosomal protein S8